MYVRLLGFIAVSGMAFSLLSACTTSGEPEDIEVDRRFAWSSDLPESSSVGANSSSSDAGKTVAVNSRMKELFDWETVPAGRAVINSVKFDFESFAMTTTEVTQDAYAAVMGKLPQQPKEGDLYPVVNVSWFDAVLFCNAFSKLAGLDTVYTYTSIGDKNFLEGVSIDYSVRGIRLPTEIEWEIAAHGGTETRFYWDTDKAVNYAYYGQSKGPEEVAKFIANAYGFYDMAGNAAEWVNDWYAIFPTKDQSNYAGPSQGTLRVLRGGGWSDAIKDCAPDVREKKDPLYTAMTVGFRVVYTDGF